MSTSQNAGGRLRATLIKLPDATPGLLILGGEQKPFVLEGMWRAATAPAVGLTVEVELTAEGAIASIHALDAQQAALEQGQRVAQLSQKALGVVVQRMGKVPLAATVLLWVSFFFLPTLDLGLASFTLWDVLGIDTSSALALMRGSSSHGLFSVLGLAAIAAPLAAPFLKSRRAGWLYAAPLAFLALLVLKVGWGMYQTQQAASSLMGGLGGEMNAAMQTMQAAARDAMIESTLSALAWGLSLAVLASGVLFVHALKLQGPVGSPASGTPVASKPVDKRLIVALVGSAAAVATVAFAISLLARLVQGPETRAQSLFEDLNQGIAAAQGDCPKLGKSLKSFFAERGSDFEALAELSPEKLTKLEDVLSSGMQRSQLSIGNSFAICSRYPEFGVGVTALRTHFDRIARVTERAKLAAPIAAERNVAAKAKEEASFLDSLFSKGPSDAKPAAAAAAAAAAPPARPPAPVAAAAPLLPAQAAAATPRAAAPAGAVAPAAAPASAPVQPKTTYAVFDVPDGDVLNARMEPSFSSQKVFDLQPASGGWLGGDQSGPPGNEWIQLQRPDVSGWVKRSLLVEERQNPCADPRLSGLGERFIDAVRRADGALLRSLVSPLHGLQVRTDIGAQSVRVKQADTATLFSSAVAHVWTDSSRKGSFKDVVQPVLLQALAGAVTQTCGRIVQPASSSKPPTLPTELRGLVPLSLSATQAAPNVATWVLGIEFLNGAPTLAALIEYAPPGQPAAAGPAAARLEAAPVPKAAEARVAAKTAAPPAAAAAVPAASAPAPPAVEAKPRRKLRGRATSAE